MTTKKNRPTGATVERRVQQQTQLDAAHFASKTAGTTFVHSGDNGNHTVDQVATVSICDNPAVRKAIKSSPVPLLSVALWFAATKHQEVA